MPEPTRIRGADSKHPRRTASARLGARLGAAAVLAALLALVLTSYLRRDDSWSRVQSAGTLRIGYAIEAPYAFVDAEGRVTGEGPDIARQVAARLGLDEPQWILTDFGDLIRELEAGRFDAIAAGLFITEERKRRVAFSRPTARVHAGLLVARGNPHRLHAYADALARPDLRLAALKGSVESQLLAAAGLPDTRLILAPDAITGLELLHAGTVAGLALSAPAVRWMATEGDNASWAEAAHPFDPASSSAAGQLDEVAFAFRPADRHLRQRWDAALADFMAGDMYLKIEYRYGFDPIPVPAPRP